MGVGLQHVPWVPVPGAADVSADVLLFPVVALAAPPLTVNTLPVHALTANCVA